MDISFSKYNLSVFLLYLFLLLPICQRPFFQLKVKGLMLKVLFVFEPLTLNLDLLTVPVENKGFEPLTPCVQGRCSSQLS